ncbi:hypothetical protein BH23ACT3_BH23ACT3_17740 [soil metagenome]
MRRRGYGHTVAGSNTLRCEGEDHPGAIVGENGLRLLSTFARSVPAAGTIEEILDHLVASVASAAPHAMVATLSVDESRTPEYVSASNESARRIERIQMAACGPSAWALRECAPVLIDDLEADARFPRFAELVGPVGVRAASSFPLVHDNSALGVLSLYRSEPGALAVPDATATQVLSDITAAHLLGARARDEARDEAERFKHLSLHDPLTGAAEPTDARDQGRARCAAFPTEPALSGDHVRGPRPIQGHQ